MPWRVLALLLLAVSASAEVRVTVRNSDGQAIDRAYVAFIAPDRPFARPNAEAIAARGVATLQVPAGTYQALVAAGGFQEETRSVRVAETGNLSFTLAPAVPMSGTVLDAEGKPIEKARVSQLRAVGPAQLSAATELARRHFASEWSTRTDANGRWSLPGRSDGSVALLFEAEGYAAQHAFRAATDTSAVTLQRGARLRLTVHRPEPAAFITLIPEQAEGWERNAWARVAGGEAPVWDSMPLGKYTLFLADFDPRAFAPRTQLATLELKSDTRLTLTLPRRPKAMLDAVTLFTTTRELRDLKASVNSGGTASVVAHALERASGGTLIHLATTGAPESLFLTTAESILTARRRDEPGDVRASSIETVVSPRADVRIRLAPGAAPPRWAVAQYSACAEAQRPSIATMPSTEGVIDLPFPTACRTLLLRVEPYAPIAIFTTLQPKTLQTMGPFGLRPAGSARVRVVREPGGEIVPRAVVHAALPDERGEETVVAHRVADDEGVALLTGLPVDADVTFTAKTEDRNPLTGSTIVRVLPAEIAIVDPLVIPRPAAIELNLRLAASVRERVRGAKITSVFLEHDRGRRSANAGDETIVFRDLPPGQWRPHVLIEGAGSIHPVPLESIDLRAGETRSIDAVVDPPVFEGQIVRAGKPLPTQAGFQGTSRDGMRRFTRSDDAGRFTVILPERGMYNVTVTPLDRPDTVIDVGEIDFSDPRRRAIVAVPTAALRVRVLEDGRPAPNADVRLSLLRPGLRQPVSSRRSATTDAGGEALLDGLLEGNWLVEAISAGGRAEAAAVVRDDRATIELEVRPASTLRGIVRHADNAVEARARVDCLFVGPSGIPQSVRTMTDGEGRFAFDLPTPPPTRLNCGVSANSGRTAAYTLSATTSADLVLPAKPATLRIGDWDARRDRDAYWLVSGDRMFNLSWSNGTAHLPAGSWKIVRATSLADWIRLATAGGNALSPIREFRLEEGEATTIRLHSDGGEE